MQDKHPITYINKKLSPKNQVLLVYNKELLAIIHAVEKWHSYLSIMPFVIRTDQKSLRYLLEQKLTTPSQFGWLTKLMGLTYEIQYKKGNENTAADALSRASHGELPHIFVSVSLQNCGNYLSKNGIRTHSSLLLSARYNNSQDYTQSISGPMEF